MRNGQNLSKVIMRIGIDVRCLLDEPRSGVGEYTFNFLQKIFKENKNCRFILFTSGRKKDTLKNIRNLFHNFSNVEFYHLYLPNKLINFLWWLGLGPDIDKLLKVDKLWFPHFNFSKVSNSCRTVVTCHDVSFINLKNLYSLKGKLWHWFVRPLKFYSKSDVILSVSQSTKNDLMHLGFEPDKIKVVYPIVSGKLKDEASGLIKDTASLPEKYFFYVGTLDARKNILTLLDAFSEFKKSHTDEVYLLLGGRLGWHSSYYYKKIFSLINKNQYIRYLGYIDRHKLPFFYRQALAFVYPSFYEGFGFPPLEAMQNGCPVITSYSSSLTEVVKNAAFLIDPYNKNDLIQSFFRLSEDVDLRNELVTAGKSIVKFWSEQEEVSLNKLINILKGN